MNVLRLLSFDRAINGVRPPLLINIRFRKGGMIGVLSFFYYGIGWFAAGAASTVQYGKVLPSQSFSYNDLGIVCESMAIDGSVHFILGLLSETPVRR